MKNLIGRRWRQTSRNTITFKESHQLSLLTINITTSFRKIVDKTKLKHYRKSETSTVIPTEKSVASHTVSGSGTTL